MNVHATCKTYGCQNHARLLDQKRDADRIAQLERERDARHFVCEAHVPSGDHDGVCPCCEAVHLAKERDEDRAIRDLNECSPWPPPPDYSAWMAWRTKHASAIARASNHQ